jgi:ribosomal protein S18 acetylase RimI-like enzyme
MSDQRPAPTTRHDKTGRAFTIRPWQPSDLRALEEFYATFEPKRGAQGLPPEDPERIHRWLRHSLQRGVHLVVIIDDSIVGHLLLMPVAGKPDTCELANFIHQSVRNCGIGTIVNRVAAETALVAGIQSLWLSVEPSNTIAIRSYENAGFRRIPGSLWAPEMEMELQLSSISVHA